MGGTIMFWGRVRKGVCIITWEHGYRGEYVIEPIKMECWWALIRNQIIWI